MKSRLLSSLDAAIAAATQPVQADCLRAERAGLLARQGQLAEARAVIASLQAQYALKSNAAVSAWVALADGLLSHFSDLNRVAHDRMRRAHALSGAARDMRLQALAAAWLAHMDYAAYDLEPMARHVAEALQLADADHHGPRARACLVVALAYHFGNRFESAQPWYAKARLHANAEGDETTLSAIMYNMAGLLTDQARQLMLTGTPDTSVARRAMLSLESTSNFDALIGTASLNALVPLNRARVCSMQGQWAEAVSLYEAHFSDGLLQGLDRMRAWLGADLAWCRLQLGQTEQALKEAMAAEVAVAHDRDVDDRAAAHSRLAQIFTQLGQIEAAARHSAQAAIDWRAHERDQAAAVAVMDRVLAKTRG
jgi:tetratricopeptide (TPR) repeat protein